MNADLKRRQLLAAAAKLPILLAAVGTGGGIRLALASGGLWDRHQLATLERIAWLLFPFPELGQDAYQRVVAGLQESVSSSPEQQELVTAGIQALDELAGGAFVDVDQSRQLELLREIEQGGFFGLALQTTQSRLFNDRELWALVGYEGSSLEFGGYLNRGLDDIDWLPKGEDHE